MVVREPEWDDVERDKMLDLADHEAELCACGLPASVADEHPDPNLEIVARKCPICAETDRGVRMLHARDSAEMESVYGQKPPPPEAALPDDGRHLAVRLKPPAAEQSPAGA